MTKEEIIKYFEKLANPDISCDGLERFLSINGLDVVFDRLKNEKDLKINKVQLNQLFLLSGLTNITFGFYKYYWLTIPKSHPYDLKKLELGYAVKDADGNETLNTIGGFDYDNIDKYYIFDENTGDYIARNNNEITTLEQLRWGFIRIYSDSLLYFGNITLGFSILNRKTEQELYNFFKKKTFDINLIQQRGHCIEFNEIEQNDRYLISEAVCKNLDAKEFTQTELRKKLLERYNEAVKQKKPNVKVGVLLDNQAVERGFKDVESIKRAKEQEELKFTMEDDVTTTEFIEQYIKSEEDIDKIIEPLYRRFIAARKAALQNTKLYLSLVNDLDVYVATSMRTKDNFLSMAKNCYEIFHESPPSIKEFNLRYFDPTISAAEGHDDKGLIECLMVKCAKVLVYTSGISDSYGKDVEAGMALTSGKPVIFLCPDLKRYNISKNIHPLTKLIDFETGVANGAMVAKNVQEVRTLIQRLFKNEMTYMVTSAKVEVENFNGKIIEKTYFKLKETMTTSTIRIQTSDLFLTKSFWNYFNRFIRDN